ncbi:hypothetical protein BJY52DRAFT_1205783 [Lactarius psammicola]|nr:hypothetical protein BJY52DRAFT_1205783 [Lactarius psammicola]
MAQSTTTSADRPERSRNAKAQARHRAKRKAYIEQNKSPRCHHQHCAFRQLEQENSKLLRENDELRRQLHMQTRRPSLLTDPHFDMARDACRRTSTKYTCTCIARPSFILLNECGGIILQSPSQTPSPPTSEALARPSNFSPPPLSHGYLPSSSTNTSAYSSPGLNSSNSMLSSGLQSGPVSYQLPAMNTPSSTSTPTSYSATPSETQPGHENPSSHSLVGSHGLPSSRLSGASQYPSSHYDSVKVEEDYMSPTQESSQNMSYSPVHSFSHHPHQAELSSWHSYSADRTQIHP